MFDSVEDHEAFLDICTQNRIKWFRMNKGLINSDIFVGWYQDKKTFIRKKILMANADYDLIEQDALSNSIYSKDFTVFKEIYINKLVQRSLEVHNVRALKILTTFVSVENDRPVMNIILPYVRRTLQEYQDRRRDRFQKHAFKIAQAIILQMYLMDTLHIHHGDLHEENIMLEQSDNPEKVHILIGDKDYRFSSNIHVYIIDFGLAHVDPNVSNFQELKRFFTNATGFRLIASQIGNLQNYNDLFEKFFL